MQHGHQRHRAERHAAPARRARPRRRAAAARTRPRNRRRSGSTPTPSSSTGAERRAAGDDRERRQRAGCRATSPRARRTTTRPHISRHLKPELGSVLCASITRTIGENNWYSAQRTAMFDTLGGVERRRARGVQQHRQAHREIRRGRGPGADRRRAPALLARRTTHATVATSGIDSAASFASRPTSVASAATSAMATSDRSAQPGPRDRQRRTSATPGPRSSRPTRARPPRTGSARTPAPPTRAGHAHRSPRGGRSHTTGPHCRRPRPPAPHGRPAVFEQRARQRHPQVEGQGPVLERRDIEPVDRMAQRASRSTPTGARRG